MGSIGLKKELLMIGAPHPTTVIRDYERRLAELSVEANRDRELLLAELDAEDRRRWISLSTVLMIVSLVALVLAMSGAAT
jgi:hypothetical protein